MLLCNHLLFLWLWLLLRLVETADVHSGHELPLSPLALLLPGCEPRPPSPPLRAVACLPHLTERQKRPCVAAPTSARSVDRRCVGMRLP